MELLNQLYSIHSKSGEEKKMRRFVKRMCEQFGAVCEINGGNLYAVKGESVSYPCVVAHLDQVQRKHAQDFKVFNHDGILFAYSANQMMQQGLGADDKNGIWVALKCLERFDAIKVAFFVGEETGCVGSSRADMSFFDDCRFVVQCDRRGGSDFISDAAGVDLCSKEFIQAVGMEEFGYKETNGSVTDVMALKENGLKVSACNLSCGYYKPHTDEETTVLAELKNCLNFVCHIIETCTDVYPHKYEYISRYGRYGFEDWYGYSYGGYSYGWNSNKDDKTEYYDSDMYDAELENTIYDLLWYEPDMKFDALYRDISEYFPGVSKEVVREYYNTFKDYIKSEVKN